MTDLIPDKYDRPAKRPRRSFVHALVAIWAVSSTVSCAQQGIIAPYPQEALFGLWENADSSILIAFHETLEFKRYRPKAIEAGIWIIDDRTGELMLRPGILTTASGERLDVRRIFPPEASRITSLREKRWQEKIGKEKTKTWTRVTVSDEQLERIKKLKQDGRSITQISLSTGLSKQVVDWIVYTELVGTGGS